VPWEKKRRSRWDPQIGGDRRGRRLRYLWIVDVCQERSRGEEELGFGADGGGVAAY